jgi:hypothetical protein
MPHPAELAQALDPEARATERLAQRLRQLDRRQAHVVLERRVAEEHVEQLRGIARRGGQRKSEGRERLAPPGLELEHARQHLALDCVAADRLARQLHCLLEPERLDAGLGIVAADAVACDDLS